MENILEIKHLSKRIGDRMILKDISFKLEENKLLGLIGNNGAGKTTLIKLIVGLFHEDSGSLTLFGQNPYTMNDDAKLKIGIAFDSPYFMNDLDAMSNLIYFSNYYKMETVEVEERFAELSSAFNFYPGIKKISEYSKGMKQKLNLIRALLHKPQLLILDEPYNGLDVTSQGELKKIILDLKKKELFTIIISSHNLHHLEDIADDILMLDNGEIKFYKSMFSLVENNDFIYNLTFACDDIKTEIEKLNKIQNIRIGLIEKNRCEVIMTNGSEENIVFLLSEYSIFPLECSRKKENLESIMLSYNLGGK